MVKTPPGTASNGHTFQCHTCGWQHDRVAALISHMRLVHHRKLSRPEFYPITERQARDFLARLLRREG